MTLKTKYQNQLIAIITKWLPNCTIYLFGSRAINQEKSGSDIDIALDCSEPIPYDTILKILREIDDTTIPVKIDLVDFYKAPDELKQDILREGIRWKN